MSWLLAVGYLLAHFAVYALFLRHANLFLHERPIFLYHFLSILTLACLLLTGLTLWPAGISLPAAVAVLSLHGIYSLSFLELWSLAEGGYSLSILRRVNATHDCSFDPSVRQLASIGASKKEARIQSLAKLRLLRQRGEAFELTGPGRAAATALQAISWTANLRSHG
jgi:hypothetical protein